MIEVKDHQLECAKCGNPFVFTAKEAARFNDKGLTNIPKKCPDCRAKDRAKQEQKVREPVQCAECGASFEVPFEPARNADGSLARPLYCVEHFEKSSSAS
ncbi:MAG TPA: zinc-ribbon domain containing protein [Patescibacteria group bacterium]|jgi:CxxC-x17-CxxC domain-containing protein